MRSRILLVAGAIAVLSAAALASAQPSNTKEFLVTLTTPIEISRIQGVITVDQSFGFELYNHGPNSIFCSIGQINVDGGPNIYDDAGFTATVDIAREIPAAGYWSGRVPQNQRLWCVAKTATQLTTAATVVTEVP